MYDVKNRECDDKLLRYVAIHENALKLHNIITYLVLNC